MNLIKGASFLITGGAGFIGSNIVEHLLKEGAGLVRVLDDMSTGYYENIRPFEKLENFEFLKGNVCDLDTCRAAVKGINYISHQAALGSVPRSIKDPINSNLVNIGGHLNMLIAAKSSPSLKRLVYAASSSSFGNSSALPKVEGEEGSPLSPYAITKWVNELYGEVFSKVYDFHTIGLRYFNVFGPNQNPNNPYAAVIPLFLKAALNNEPPVINGDGSNSRDFTYVENAVQANIKALLYTSKLDRHEVVNIAIGERTSLLELWSAIKDASGVSVDPKFVTPRKGDIAHSLASIEKAKKLLGYNPKVRLPEGVNRTYEWFKRHYADSF